MPGPPQRFDELARQFEALMESLNEKPNKKKRSQLLQRMRLLINEIDGLDSSALGLDKEDATITPDQPVVESS
jgi:hypothetical protein